MGVFADLFRKTRALAELNASLASRVQERTAELEKSEAALRAADEQKDQFLATLAHELRNPLAPVRTGLDILLREPDVSARAHRTLAAMNRQLDYMVRLVDDLLDVSRTSRGTLEIRREEVAIVAVIDRAIEMVAPALVRRTQTVGVDATGDGIVLADATRIAQIIGNLLSNASKHSPAGATIRVELRRAANGESVVVRVRDEGVGIPRDQLDRVFDMFAKIERATSEPNDGLGIGLALSRRLAELHGGTLSVESEGEGTGATFTLSFPIGIKGFTELRTEAAESPKRDTRNRLRIVLIEDNEDAADTMVEWLRLVGHEAQVARSGPDGVALALDTRPDVVLCDIGLPGIDGVEVCRRIISAMPKAPTMVALTGWGQGGDRRRTIEAGFQHHLVKPVALEKLQAILESVERAR